MGLHVSRAVGSSTGFALALPFFLLFPSSSTLVATMIWLRCLRSPVFGKLQRRIWAGNIGRWVVLQPG